MREDIIETRLEKLERLRAVFSDIYPETTKRDTAVADALDGFDAIGGKPIVIAGRVRSLRSMGKIAFAHLEDGSGKMQIFLKADALEDPFQIFTENIDLGDFVEAEGTLFRTKTEEKTLLVSRWKLLGKSTRPIPSEFYGLKDEEELLRRRYLDLLANPETRELFRKKNAFWTAVRTFLASREFLEVSTPVLEHVPGGAEAEPFITHHNALDADFYLRISLELSLKRLLVGGYERVFEIGRVFRNEGIDREHLQEFDHCEFYAAYTGFEEGMAMVEELYRAIARAVAGQPAGATRGALLAGDALKTTYEGQEIDWSKPFPRIDYFTEFKKETGIDLSSDVTIDVLKTKADELGIKYEKNYGKGRMIDTLYKKTVRQKLIEPCFLVGHPLEVSPLAKTDPTNPKKALRMQPVALKSELGNGFAELNDPMDQRRRFEEQMKLRAEGDKEGMMLDEDFLEALEYGMPPAFGFGFSERLFAILMGRSVRETVIFPPVRSKE